MPGVVAEVGSTANNYQILAKLAMGGMAEIFLARGISTAGVERYVVLKRIIRDKANDTHFVQMFLEEARLAAQLQHANIAQVYDIGKLGDSYFFTMEYVHGETVRGLLQRARSLRREIPLGLVLTVIAGTAAGLHHAHDRIGIDGRPLGIVHRDVSPSNLMISYDGSVKVVDFGVAKAENRAHETRSGAVKGKISYLSPEQCRGAPVDRRSDLFSLGIVLWEMLTVERLYRRSSDFENMSAIVTEPVPPPSIHRPGIPRDLEQLSIRLLAKRAEDRFQSAEQLIEAIEEVCAKNQLVLSGGALGRFMKELFGQRPEPWVEMEAPHAAEGVTVTSEPIPIELSSASDPMEAQLRQVRDLSKQYAAQRHPASESIPPPIAAMSQLLTAEAVPILDNTVRPTVSMRPASAAPLPPPPSHTPDMLATVPMYRAPMATPANPFSTSASQPGTGSAVVPYPMVASAPTGSATGGGTNVKVIAAVAALCVGVGIVAWLLVRDRGEAPKLDEFAGAPADAATTVVVAPPDAAIAQVTIDAAVAAVGGSDAPIDAPQPVVAPEDPLAPLQAALAQGRYAEGLAGCGSVAISPELGLVCTRLACKLGDAAKAKQWIARAAKIDRGVLEAECKRDGTELAPRPKTGRPPRDTTKVDPCKADPMSCQH